MRQPNEKSHRNRKNPRSAELYRQQNREQNAARPKQVVIVTVVYDKDGTRNEIYTRARD